MDGRIALHAQRLLFSAFLRDREAILAGILVDVSGGGYEMGLFG